MVIDFLTRHFSTKSPARPTLSPSTTFHGAPTARRASRTTRDPSSFFVVSKRVVKRPTRPVTDAGRVFRVGLGLFTLTAVAWRDPGPEVHRSGRRTGRGRRDGERALRAGRGARREVCAGSGGVGAGAQGEAGAPSAQRVEAGSHRDAVDGDGDAVDRLRLRPRQRRGQGRRVGHQLTGLPGGSRHLVQAAEAVTRWRWRRCRSCGAGRRSLSASRDVHRRRRPRRRRGT